jgi:predicted RNA binding protein YcfA (HicA-like mRNA interferase family)
VGRDARWLAGSGLPFRLPVVSAKKVIKALEKLGFKIYRQPGSHIHLWNEERNLVVTVPNHPDLAKGTLISIMK